MMDPGHEKQQVKFYQKRKKFRLWSDITGRTELRYVCEAHVLRRYISSILTDRWFFKLYTLIIRFFVHNCTENKPCWGSDSQSTDK